MRHRSCIAAAIAASLLVLGAAQPSAAAPPRAPGAVLPNPCADRTPHPPIRISEDEGPLGFIAGHAPGTGEPIPRPGSGVVSGTGTPDDPYVIAGWCIPGPWAWGDWLGSPPIGSPPPALRFLHGVVIENTSAHVRFEDNLVQGFFEFGVWVNNARNVAVEANTVTSRVAFAFGIRLSGTEAVTVDGNVVTTWVGIDLAGVDGALVRGNTVTSQLAGITLSASHGNRLAGNTVTGADDGITLVGSNANVVEGNRVADSSFHGVWLLDSHETLVTRNTVVDSGDGIHLQDAPHSTVHDNHVADNVVGVRATTDVADATVHANNIEGNGTGVDGTSADQTVDARFNWWGCPNGPSDPDCDPVEGPVTSTPWRTEPNPAAGAG